MTTDRDAVSPTEAAQRLGITPDAVRARLRRGTLAGERVGGDWHVFLPQFPRHDRRDADTTTAVDRHDTDTTPIGALIAAKDETIAAQREEIAFLRRELETRTDELQRRDVLLREAMGRIPQLPAGDDARSTERVAQGEAESSVRSPGLAGRLSAPQALVVAVGAGDRLIGAGSTAGLARGCGLSRGLDEPVRGPA